MCFAVNQISIRRGVHQAGESSSAVIVTVFLGTLFFSVALLFSGEWETLWSISWQSYALLGAAGVVNFVIGRGFSYNCIRLIGGTRAGPLHRTNILVAVTLAVLFMNESLNLLLILGIFCIATGAILVGLSGRKVGEEEISRSTLTKGILAGIGTGFCWGVTPVLVKAGIQGVDSPITAVFISYAAASLVLVGFLFRKEHQNQLSQLSRSSLAFLATAGTFNAAAQIFRYTALDRSPVSIVTPLGSTSVVFALLLSFLVNRKIEGFNRKIVIGTLATVVGAFLIF